MKFRRLKKITDAKIASITFLYLVRKARGISKSCFIKKYQSVSLNFEISYN